MPSESIHTNGPPVLRGRVKWFDAGKGFGFIRPEGGGDDVLLHVNVLRDHGHSTVSDGADVVVVTQRTERGLQVSEIISLVPPPLPPTADIAEVAGIAPETLDGLALQPARIKWFDRARGFGFANVFGVEEDVFLHAEVLRRSGFAGVEPGEALSLRCVEGRNGLVAVLVAPWEAAIFRGCDWEDPDGDA